MRRMIRGTVETGRTGDTGDPGTIDLGQEHQRKGEDPDQSQEIVDEGQGQETGIGDQGPEIEKGTGREKKNEKGERRDYQQ